VDTRRKHRSRTRIGLRIGAGITRLTLDGNEFEGLDQDLVDLRSA
jgi:hypothetical protein